MNTRMLILALSVSVASFAGSAHADTSLGTSKVRTAGGSKKLKYSVVQSNTLQAVRNIAASLNNYNMKNILASGYRVTVPKILENEVQIRPWKQGEEHVLNARGSQHISDRLTRLMAAAQRLHDKAEISDQDLRNVQQLKTYADAFSANAALLAQYKVAISMDE